MVFYFLIIRFIYFLECIFLNTYIILTEKLQRPSSMSMSTSFSSGFGSDHSSPTTPQGIFCSLSSLAMWDNISTHLDSLEPTHRGLHRFYPRHQDELELDIGDPIYVVREAEDLWCEGWMQNIFRDMYDGIL